MYVFGAVLQSETLGEFEAILNKLAVLFSTTTKVKGEIT